MKRILATSAAALVVLAGAASAMTSFGATEAQVKQFIPNADLSGYSETAIQHINSILSGASGESWVDTKVDLEGALKVLK